MEAKEILKTADEENVHFLRLEFTDIMGVLKNVEIPRSQFEKALDGQIMFDGSSIEGFTRIEESDMLLHPDFDTFRLNPWKSPDGSRVGRLICDVKLPDESDFPGCPRTALNRQVARAEAMGYKMVCGPEAEPTVSRHACSQYHACGQRHQSQSGVHKLLPVLKPLRGSASPRDKNRLRQRAASPANH
jgi:glutamine synthetase